MKRIVSVLLTTSLFVIVGLAVLNILLYGNDPLLKKIGINVKNRINNEMTDVTYPAQKIVAKADTIEVRYGTTILKTGTKYKLNNLVYANAKTGESLGIDFVDVCNEKTGTNIAINRKDDTVSFSKEGVYILTILIDTEYYEVKLPVTKA